MGKKLEKLIDRAITAEQDVLKLKLSTFSDPFNGPRRGSHEYADRSIWEEFNRALHNPDVIRADLEDRAAKLKDKFDISSKIALGIVATRSIEFGEAEVERCKQDPNFDMWYKF